MKHKWLPLAILLITSILFLSCGRNGDWVSLFDGASLDGWKVSEHPEAARVENGAIVCQGERAHVFYEGPVQEHNFVNFEFSVDVLTKPGSNSGIFIHTGYQEEGWPVKGYEIQVNNSQEPGGGYYEYKKTGSLYGIHNVYKRYMPDNEWFNMNIRVTGKRVQVRLNGMLVTDYIEPDEPVRDAGSTQVLSSGTFALQCHDPGSMAMYKNIKVRPLPDDLTAGATAPKIDVVYSQIIELSGDNYPLIDYHVHLKGGLTIEEVVEKSLRDGINYGIAPNCGVGFPIQNDAQIDEFIASMQGYPVFLGMQAEGREWVDMFSKEARAKFDYVFTDAMTFTDHRGERIQIWKDEQVVIDDKQAWMDMLVEKIVGVMQEPIDIYVNATFLPTVLQSEYDELWTPERMDKVINAAVANDVAIEISNRYGIPSAAFVKRAKAAGVKFSFGTNNGGANDLARLEYGLQMIAECGLTPYDMFVPKNNRPKGEMPAGN